MNRTQFFRFITLALAASLLSGCGSGGGDGIAPVPPPPSLVWSPAQIAPVQVSAMLGVFPDAASGVFVVGEAYGDGLVVQRFNAARGWHEQTVELRGLKSLQAVPIDSGVALFGHDGTSWLRRDFTSAGLSSLQTQFAVQYPVAASATPIEVRFDRTHNNTLLASAILTRDTRAAVQTREFKQGVWTAAEEAFINAPDGGQVMAFGSGAHVVRSRAGDVASVSTSLIYRYTFVALRRVGETVFTPVTPALCVGARCASTFGQHLPPQLQADGRATVIVSQTTPLAAGWLLIDTHSVTELWPAGVNRGVEPFVAPLNVLRPDGTPQWVSNAGSQLTVWEGTNPRPWQAPTGEQANCVLLNCAAFSAREANHLATLHADSANTLTLYVSERAASGQWANTASVDASALLKVGNYGRPFSLAAVQASPASPIVVGFVPAVTSAGVSTGAVQPFAWVKQ